MSDLFTQEVMDIIATLEQENKQLRARNERLEKEQLAKQAKEEKAEAERKVQLQHAFERFPDIAATLIEIRRRHGRSMHGDVAGPSPVGPDDRRAAGQMFSAMFVNQRLRIPEAIADDLPTETLLELLNDIEWKG